MKESSMEEEDRGPLSCGGRQARLWKEKTKWASGLVSECTGRAANALWYVSDRFITRRAGCNGGLFQSLRVSSALVMKRCMR